MTGFLSGKFMEEITVLWTDASAKLKVKHKI